jgi:hypothetical protein
LLPRTEENKRAGKDLKELPSANETNNMDVEKKVRRKICAR